MAFATFFCYSGWKNQLLDEVGMIRCHLARLMGERKMKIVDVARETGLNRNTVTLLYKETAQRMELEALEKLCQLFECEVGELLEYVPE